MSEFTVGVEEEYQLVAPASGELVSQARDILAMDWSGELTPEIQETTLEIGTPICETAAEVERELGRLRLQVASAAAAEELVIVAAGTHPFTPWQTQSPTPGARYARLRERYGRVLRSEQIFGMHIHVGIPAGTDRAFLLGSVRSYIPHLLALSASSPFYGGEDTGYASYRTILAQRYPHSGPPPDFGSEDDYREFVQLLVRGGAIEDESNLYWSIRLHPRFRTLEFRGPDACPRLADAAAITALVRALVAAAADGALPQGPSAPKRATADELLSSNEWQAARFGLGAMLTDPHAAGGRTPIRDEVLRLLETLQPISEALGDGSVLAGIETLLVRGSAADRIRAAETRVGSGPELVRWLAGESMLGVGLDRRAEQRGHVPRAGS